eukprot:174048_1
MAAENVFDLDAAITKFLSDVEPSLSEMDYLDPPVREMYQQIAIIYKSHPVYIMQVDFMVIGVIGCRSGVNFADLAFRLVSINKIRLLCGASGSGKSAAINWGLARLTELETNIIKFIAPARGNDEEEEAKGDDDLDEDNDVEMTPCVDYNGANFDDVEVIDLSWNRSRVLQIISRLAAQPDRTSVFFVIQGDRHKAIVQNVIKKGGSGLLVSHEMSQTIGEMEAGGDKNASGFFISLGDDMLRSHRYSTKGLSTPLLLNVSIGLLSACTLDTMFELLKSSGLAGTARRVFTCYLQCYKVSPFERRRIMQTVNVDELNGKIDKQYFLLWKCLHMDPQTKLLKKDIPFAELDLTSTIIEYQNNYMTDHGLNDVSDVSYPDDWTDNGALKEDLLTANDYYSQIHWDIYLKRDGDEMENILLNDKPVRVAIHAFCFSARDKMMGLKEDDTIMDWDCSISAMAMKNARTLMTYFDTFVCLLGKVTCSTKSTPGCKSNNEIRSDLRERIVVKLINTAKPQCSSKDLYSSVYTKRFKGMNVAKHIKDVVNDLNANKLVTLSDKPPAKDQPNQPRSKKGGSRKWFKIITRLQIMNEANAEAQKALLSSFKCQSARWNLFWDQN